MWNQVAHLKTSYDIYIAECQNKTYGPGCLESCGRCLSGQQCNNVNGTCLNGCEAGYYKPRCKQGKYNITMYIDTTIKKSNDVPL